MIYDFPQEIDPIRQGDIFVGVPRVDISLQQLPIVGEDESVAETSWDDVLKTGRGEATAILGLKSVAAIVISQDCDTTHARDISLCEIREFRDIEGKAKDTKDAKGWVSILTQHARINQKWFYLPPDERIGFKMKMAVDFAVTLRLPRVELEALRSLRRGRLIDVADEHFREKLSEFYRRYPYDEWYPFDIAELAEYQRKHPDAKPFPWQPPPNGQAAP